MKLAIYCAISFLLICARVSSGLNVTCVHGCFICSGRPENTICNVDDIEVPTQRDRLEFNYGNGSADTITVLHLYSKKDDPGFTSIPTEIFEIFLNLEIFTITTDLKVISPTDWINATNLRRLALLKITADINAYDLNGLQKLEIFYLKWKSLGTFRRIRQNVFTGMSILLELFLSKNEIHTIEDGAFNLPKLINLNLYDNQLTMLSDLTFCELPNLEELDLRFNKLTHIGQSLYCLTNIKRIELWHNSIDDIDLLEFAKLSRLEHLDLDHSGFPFGPNAKARAVENTSLKTLILRNNKLHDPLDLHQLSIFKGLLDLDLSGNPYTDFDLDPSDIKEILPNITNLRLFRTEMSYVQLYRLINQYENSIIELNYYG